MDYPSYNVYYIYTRQLNTEDLLHIDMPAYNIMYSMYLPVPYAQWCLAYETSSLSSTPEEQP